MAYGCDIKITGILQGLVAQKLSDEGWFGIHVKAVKWSREDDFAATIDRG